MVTIEYFPESILRDFQPRPDQRPRIPSDRCFPHNVEEAAEFVDQLLMKVWDEPYLTAARKCINVPLLHHGGFFTELRGLLRVRRNRLIPVIDIRMGCKTDYIVDLVVEDLEIDFEVSRTFRCIPWFHHGTALIDFVRFSIEFSVYEEKITVDQVKMICMEGLKITELNAGCLMKRYVTHRLIELLARNYENIAFVFEYNITKIFNTVLRAFLKREI